MNEKIQALTNQLQEECFKEGVALLCTMQKDGNVKSMVIGGLAELSLCLAVQEKELSDGLPIPFELFRTNALRAFGEVYGHKGNAADQPFVGDANDLPDILARILNGEFD